MVLLAFHYFESKSGYLLTGNTYHWNNQRNDNWVSSTLNNNVLNSVYWNSLGEYQKYIATSLFPFCESFPALSSNHSLTS